jgi:hypothetical protein
MSLKPPLYSRITGTGSYLPGEAIGNAALAARLAADGVETSDQWIIERTGIKSRHFARDDEVCSDLGVHAAKRALEAADCDAAAIDLIIVATSTPDMIFPSTACNAWMSNACSATICFSRRFSSSRLRKRRIIETLAAFIGGGWLLVEVVERLLVSHYKFPEESIDLTVVSVIGALLATLVWRWFGGAEKRPGNIKIEVLLVPLIILATLDVDLIILQEIIGISGKTFLIAAVAACLGIAWIVLKSLQWAAAAPAAPRCRRAAPCRRRR